jgi:hypothetical protein
VSRYLDNAVVSEVGWGKEFAKDRCLVQERVKKVFSRSIECVMLVNGIGRFLIIIRL